MKAPKTIRSKVRNSVSAVSAAAGVRRVGPALAQPRPSPAAAARWRWPASAGARLGAKIHRLPAQRPGRSQDDEARSSRSRSRLSLRRVGIGRHAHHPLAHRVDQVEVVFERMAGLGLQPARPARRAARAAPAATGRHRARRAASAARFGASSVTSQSLSMRSRSRPSISRSWRCRYRRFSQAGVAGGRAQRPAAATGPRSDAASTGLPSSVRSGSAGRLRVGRISAAVVAARLRAQHEVAEVGRHHRRGADQQHQQHLDAADARAPRVGAAARARASSAPSAPTASARAAASRAEELEPDIKTGDEGAERKPLQRVAVVLGDIERRPASIAAAGRRPARRRRPVARPPAAAARARFRGHTTADRDFAGSRPRRRCRTRTALPGRGAMRPSMRTTPGRRVHRGQRARARANRAAPSRAAPAPRRPAQSAAA